VAETLIASNFHHKPGRALRGAGLKANITLHLFEELANRRGWRVEVLVSPPKNPSNGTITLKDPKP